MIEDKDNEMIDVKEEVDGSAVIELPESIPSPDVKVEEDSDYTD